MKLAIPIIESGLLWILRNPIQAVQATNVTDANRAMVAEELAGLEVGAWIGSRPQGSDRNLAVTIQRNGGQTSHNVDSYARNEWTMIDLTVWARRGSTRVNQTTQIRVGQLLRILLTGLVGKFDGVTIEGIEPDNVDPVENDEPPSDASDDWPLGLLWTFHVQFKSANASTRVTG